MLAHSFSRHLFWERMARARKHPPPPPGSAYMLHTLLLPPPMRCVGWRKKKGNNSYNSYNPGGIEQRERVTVAPPPFPLISHTCYHREAKMVDYMRLQSKEIPRCWWMIYDDWEASSSTRHWDERIVRTNVHNYHRERWELKGAAQCCADMILPISFVYRRREIRLSSCCLATFWLKT